MTTSTTAGWARRGWGFLLFVLTITTAVPSAAQTEIALEVLAQGLTAPLAAVEPPDDTGRLFIVDQVGQIRIVDAEGTLLPTPFLDIAARMVNLNSNFDERGLLGLAFHPDYATNGRFFVYYSAPRRAEAPSGWNHTSHIAEFTVSDSDPDRADANSERVLLQVDQPQSNHNAGAIAIGPDGHLYIALGDGGGAHDIEMGHAVDWYADNAGGNGQDVTDNLLGSILRIDVDNGDPYGIPADNPFVDDAGLDEIYAYGLRNPYRFSFDMGGDHDLLAADVGQGRWEEVNDVELGGNYGWNVYEGAHCFSASSPNSNPTGCPTAVGAGHPDEGAAMLDPVLEYGNPEVGVAVVGGYVYRGTMLPELEGKYVFGDWSRGTGVLFIATPSDTGPWTFEQRAVTGGASDRLLAFGQSRDGEMYVLGTDRSGPSGSTGTLYRIVAAGGTAAEPDYQTPQAFALRQNYPNPFNPSTEIQFDLADPGAIVLTVFDALGREVTQLSDGIHAAGSHRVTWNGRDTAGNEAPSGIYVYQLRTEHGAASRTMTLIR